MSALLEQTVNFAVSGNNNLIPAQTGKQILLFRLVIVFESAVVIQFRDGATTALTGAITFGSGGSITLPEEEHPYFTTTSGNALVLNLDSAVQVSGRAYYRVQ